MRTLPPRFGLGGVLATLGCAEDYVLAEKSELLVLLTPPNEAEDVCAGTFEKMEQDIVAVREIYGSETPLPILYHWTPRWHTPPEDFPCDRVDTACTRTNSETNEASIYARELAMTHEFVHAARGSGPMIIEEGLATMFEEPFHPIQQLLERDELLEILHSGSLDIVTEGPGLGERSAHFVSFLIAEWGMDAVVEFTSRKPSYYHAPFATWAADFEAVFGQSSRRPGTRSRAPGPARARRRRVLRPRRPDRARQPGGPDRLRQLLGRPRDPAPPRPPRRVPQLAVGQLRAHPPPRTRGSTVRSPSA